ncbi:hypothetical protein F5Y10DRAFT_273678 [Nemania abortiva]|nr:hypothetical protein F5Y10DRAFT_273678 [Nemania abortiva]
MKFPSILALVAGAVTAVAYDMSNLPNGIYKIPIADSGVIDYANAINLNINLPGDRLSRANGSTVSPEENDNSEDDEDDDGDDELHVDESDDDGDPKDHKPKPGQIVRGKHCHKHWPHHHNGFITGHTILNMTSYPLALELFTDWLTTGADGGWLEPAEVRMAKADDMVVGACAYKKPTQLYKYPRLRTCVHELGLAMQAADKDCAAGKVGCHVCVQHWHKYYFRFDASEAPSECECAWTYW